MEKKGLKIQIASDLHLEFSHIDLQCEDTDVLILAGDIHSDIGKLRRYILSLLKKYKSLHIVIVAGNHEFYSTCRTKTVVNTIERLKKLLNIHECDLQTSSADKTIYDELKEQPSHISLPQRCRFLENDKVKLQIRNKIINFVGCTLWCNPPDRYYTQIKNGISDFFNIKDHLIENCKNYFQESLQYILENVDSNTIVVSHFAPSFSSIHEKYRNDIEMIPLNYYYFTDLEDHIRDLKPILWVHGHVHSSFSYYIGDTRIICNPRGYSREYNKHDQNPYFDRNLIVQI